MARNPLHAICPYFAMFPERFVEEQLQRYTSSGDYVFDPFSGRGTTVLQSLVMGRQAAAVDVNPVAYCISAAKAEVPALSPVIRRIQSLSKLYLSCPTDDLERMRQALPPFFRRAFYHSTLREILFLRGSLDWENNRVDRFISALVLGSLHGEMGKPQVYLSNQMPRTISTKPGYSLNYWRRHGLWPKKRNVFDVLASRATYRLRADLPTLRGEVVLADARNSAALFPHLHGRIHAVITSPPYFDVTNYEEDQWLRLWFLGSVPRPTYKSLGRDSRHTRKEQYWDFLREVWSGILPLLRRGSTFVCRLGGRNMTSEEMERCMLESLRAVFPKLRRLCKPVLSQIRNAQTRSFRPDTRGCLFEMDFAFVLG